MAAVAARGQHPEAADARTAASGLAVPLDDAGAGLRIDRGTHVWNFIKVPGGVIVRTEESWTGAQIEADPATAIRYLAPGLDEWLADLKVRAEAQVCHH